FLGAGSVIHAMAGEQDIRGMGGLRSRLPVTHLTFAVAALAIAGIPPLAGFFSKDEILWSVLAGPRAVPILWAVGVLAAGITAFYMTRLYLLVFAGAPRMVAATRGRLHESPPSMTVPLVLLAVGAASAGLLGVPRFLGGGRVPNLIERWLAPLFGAPAGAAAHHGAAGISEWGALGTALAISAAGIGAAWRLFRGGPLPAGARSPAVRLVKGKFFVDEAYERIVLRPYRAACRLADGFDNRIVDGLVNAAGTATDLTSQLVRLAQTGYVRNYAFVFFLGTVAILLWALS
ncbi:MAG: proton-conducting transporter membrane subunit, partial [Acidobacteriota bacterium]